MPETHSDMRVETTSLPETPAPLQLQAWCYGRTAVVLHWTVAVLLTATAGLGWYMMSIEREPGSSWYFDLHKSVGIVIAFLVAARVLWRVANRPEELPVSVPIWQARLARVTQALLYVLIVLVPITGYLGASYSKAGVKWFGLATPAWALPDHDRAEQFFDVHSALVWVLVVMVGMHVAAALKHLLVDKDGVYQRMGFRSRHRTGHPPPR